MRAKQLSFLPKEFYHKNSAFGGTLLDGKRKTARPLSSKHPIHMVLKSSQAKGNLSFMNHRKRLDEALRTNHWMRELTAALVRVLATKTKTMLSGFFDRRPFSRIIQWGKDLKNALDYLELNQMEVFDCRPPKKKSRGKNRATHATRSS